MRLSGTRRLIGLTILCSSQVLCHWAGQAQTTNSPAQVATQEKTACSSNLKIIADAIEAYQADHKDLPNWLSDLVPQYLQDTTVLICPVARRTGKTEPAPLADPKLPSSYLFEFCPVPLGNLAPNAPDKTRRDWKRRQMGLLGSVVPMVRCRFHSPSLNLAFDGKVYEAPATWELAFTNRVNQTNLLAATLFAGEPAPKATNSARFPLRDTQAKPGMLDLSRFYNAVFGEAWLGVTNQTLNGLPKGLQKLAGVDFDVRAVVQLSGRALTNKKFPSQAKGIVVRQKCRRLNFIHSAAFVSDADEGQKIGSYLVHYTGNPAVVEVPIVVGKDVRNWIVLSNEKADSAGPTLAWSSEKSSKRPGEKPVRLFKTVWSNLAPDAEIESIDFVSAQLNPAPFLVAVTAE